MLMRISVAIVFATLSYSPQVISADNDISIRGFSTIGLTHSSNEHLGFRRNLARTSSDPDTWSFEPDSLVGIQVDADPSDQWHVSAQAVYKNRIEQSLDNSIEWAYVRYQPSINSPFSYRLGRLGVDVFMLSQYRNVGFAYLWARPPQEFYSPLGFDSINGADLTYAKIINDAYLQARLAIGVTKTKFNYNEAELDISPAIAASLLWEEGHWKTRLGYARIELDNSIELFAPVADALQQSSLFWPQATTIEKNLDLTGKVFDYYSFGLAYDNNTWIAQTEINLVESKDTIFTSSQSAYLSIGRRFGDLTLYGLGSMIENTDPIFSVPDAPAPLTLLQIQTQELYNSTGVEQKGLGIGVRWDLTSETALKFQWDRVWIKPHGSGLWGKELSNPEKERSDILSINLSYIF